ncbi:MAG TPA: fumarylacetoacetate hydrolase family protein [Clostridia bacterium]|nr:fumarylacetoacetate hydrolase family protein [Clostridia bacterium]
MRLATVVEDGRSGVGLVRGGRVLVLPAADERFRSLRSIAAGGAEVLERAREWADRQPDEAYRAIGDVELGPAVPDPGAIYTIGLNYRDAGEPPGRRPERPFVYGKVASSTSGHGATVAWDRSLTANVDPEAELGVVIGEPAVAVSPETALDHVFGYTCINDISSRDPWLDGDQWLLGKSFAGFCPVGPWVVTRDEIDPIDLGIGCILNGIPIQDGRTGQMRFSIAEIVSYLSRHVALRPGDLIATGTPARLPSPLGPDRHLEAGDVVTVWIERIGELTTSIA